MHEYRPTGYTNKQPMGCNAELASGEFSGEGDFRRKYPEDVRKGMSGELSARDVWGKCTGGDVREKLSRTG